MRSADRSRQYCDKNCFEGVLCTSCRLAVNKDTGRLKWCMGGNDIWRARIRYMLLIPTVILPITIIFIVLSRSNVTGRNTMRITQGDEDNRPETLSDDHIFSSTIQSVIDDFEREDKTLGVSGDTSFVPFNSFITETDFQRSKEHFEVKRNSNRKSHGKKISDDLYADDTLDKDVKRNVKKRNINQDYLNNLQELQTTRDDFDAEPENLYEQIDYSLPYPDSEVHSTEVESDICDYSNQDDLINNSKTILNDLKDVKDSSRSMSSSREEMDEDKLQLSEDENNSDDKLLTDNEAEFLSDNVAMNESPDFNVFWRNDGNMNTIRKAQAKMMLKYMDRTVDPCQDFYQYACGNWAKQNPIPKDKVGYDTFEMLRESLDLALKKLLEEPIPHIININNDDAIIKVKKLFQSCMNHEILEQRREYPLLELLNDLGGWPTIKPDWSSENFDWLVLVAKLRLYNNDILISEWIGPDIKNSDQYVIQFDQTSLGLPTRDYFLQPSNKIYLEAYKNYFIKIAILLGSSLENASIYAEEMIEFEIQLAKITSSPKERRNVSELYQKMTLGELRALVPQIDWHHYLTIVLARPVNASEPVIVFALQYIKDLVVLLSETPPRTISNYLLWRFVRHRVNNLDDRFQEAKQKFYYILFGREQAPPRWKICVSQVNVNMGMAVGSLFVKRYFDENSKNDTLMMMQELQQSFKELLDETNWIDNETKKLANEKADAMSLRIGYPDYILHHKLLNERYKDVVIHTEKYFENTLNILQHLTRVEQDRLGSPVNKTLWNTAPAVVNAYYSRNKNQIIFPAGILQPPFYHKYYPKSLNYGGIGVVIGHEITHGFDKGRLFDKNGNLHRWWKEEAIRNFQQRAQCLIDQYNQYTVTEVGMQIDGMNTQGENIADNCGIKQAFNAYEKWLKTNGDFNETLPGLNATSKQLFFLNFAQVWCGSLRPEAVRNRLKTAVHSPGKFRVIGTLSNFKEFAQVFKCSLGSPMNPFKKCSVW